MRDLETAGRAVVAEPVAAPTAVEVIEARGRRRRRRRSGLRAGVAVAAAIGVIASVVAVRASRDTSARHDIVVAPTDKAAITDPQLRAHLGLDVPAGWMPVDSGDARLFAPTDWKVTAGGCGGSAPGWIEVGGPYKEDCGVRAPTYIGVYDFVDKHEPTPVRTVNGYAVYRANAANPNDFVVPALKVTIRAEGPMRDEILATLAPSSRFIALTTHPPTPSDWRTVSYSGITLRVPNAWGQAFVGACDVVRPDEVGLDNDSGVANGCTQIAPPATGPTDDNVRIGQPELVTSTTRYSLQVSNANGTSMELPPDTDNQALAGVVQFDGHGVPLTIGLGRDGRIAAAIFDSIQVDQPATTKSSDPSTATAAAIRGVWKATSITGYTGALTNPPLGSAPLLQFDTATTWGGSDGCNGFEGTYTLDRTGFHAGRQIFQTLVGCRVTVPLRQLMTTANRVIVVGDTLTLLDGRNKTLATYERVKTPQP